MSQSYEYKTEYLGYFEKRFMEDKDLIDKINKNLNDSRFWSNCKYFGLGFAIGFILTFIAMI